MTSHTTPPCTLDGYPDASLTSSTGPAVLAYRAGQANALLPVPAIPRPVTLTDGASASATLATAAPDTRDVPYLERAVGRAPAGSSALRVNRTFHVCGAVPGAGAFVSA